MSDLTRTATAQSTRQIQSPAASGLLQRKCACGQHTTAGGECAECAKKKSGLQRKLTIGASNDPLELEADRVADQVMTAPANPVISSALPRIQRYAGQTTEGADIAPASVDRVLASSGRPLDPTLQQDMGQRFGHDFSRVRVHTGGAAEQSAREVNANAYAVGHDIVFGAGRFAPEMHEGRRLIAHELTHVVQQSGSDGTPGGHNDGKGALFPTERGSFVSTRPSDHISLQRQKAKPTDATDEPQLSTVFLAHNERLLSGPLAAEIIRLGLVPNEPVGVIFYANGYGFTQPVHSADVVALALEVTRKVDGKEVFVGYEVTSYGQSSSPGSSQATNPKTTPSTKTAATPRTTAQPKNVKPGTPLPQPKSSKPTSQGSNDGALEKKQEQKKKQYEQLPVKSKEEVNEEVDRRYYDRSGNKPGTTIEKGEERKSQMWREELNQVIKEKETIESLPPAIRLLMGPEASYKPKDFQRLLNIAEKLKRFTPEDLAVYKLLTIRATTDLDLFEKSVDMFLARKEELKKALAEQQQKRTSDKESTLKDATDEKWKGLDESSIRTMSEDERYKLARQKTSELTDAQLKYMKEHPGEVLKDFAKSATLVNTPETFSAIGKDIQEAASGDANAWARWAAGTGAGAKLSGWMMAVAGVLFVASWLTGIGELATIAAGAGILLGATLTLSAAESELRIKAASQAKTPEEFKRNVELAAAARTNVVVGVALIVIAAVLHFTAKAFFPETLKKINTSIKNFRERVRLKGSINELKPKFVTEMDGLKGELSKSTELAKKNAMASAEALDKLSTEEFVDKLETGDGGFLDQAKLPPEQKVSFREFLKTPEGRAAIESYKAKLVNALRTDVVQEVDKLAQEYNSKIDEFLKDVEAAKNHDDLNGALDKIEGTLTEEHAKKFMADEQDKIVKQKLTSAIDELKAETEAKANAEAKAKAEEASAEQWLDDLGKSLSEAGKKRLDAIRRGQKTAKDTRELVQKQGGQDFLEGKTDPAKIISDPQKLAALKAFENDPNFLNRSAVKQAATIANEAKAAELVRSELAAEIALRRVRAAYAAKPGTNIYEGVRVLREQPNFKTAADYKAANPKYRGPIFERGGKVFKPDTDIDLLVTEKAGAQSETIKHMEEIKSGGLDTPGEAKVQLETAQKALDDRANGDLQVRLELADGTDLTSRFDARSASKADVATTGPSGPKGGWTETLGVTADDLLDTAKEILMKLKGAK